MGVGETILLTIARVKRVFERIQSRYSDYSGLRHASSVSEAVNWFQEYGTRMFNGNVLRAKIIQGIVETARCNVLIETGTSHAATAVGAGRFLGIPVWSCENSTIDYMISKSITAGMHGIKLYKQDSRDFVNFITQRLIRDPMTPIFYLDAHEGRLDAHSLPLLDELEALSLLETFVVVIDDFQVPQDNNFEFGTYGEVSIEISLIRKVLLSAGIKRCFFPSYLSSEETGFVTGFCILWRSEILDKAVGRGNFPFNLIRAIDLEPEKDLKIGRQVESSRESNNCF